MTRKDYEESKKGVATVESQYTTTQVLSEKEEAGFSFSEETKKNLSRVFGMDLDAFQALGIEEQESYLERLYGKPSWEERKDITTMEQVDKKMDVALGRIIDK